MTKLQEALSRLLKNQDFRYVLVMWMDEMGSKPYSGHVTAEMIGEVSYHNGRASWLQQLMSELQEEFPDLYEQVEQERMKHARARMAERKQQQPE